MITVPVNDGVLMKAIELRISECFGAMNIANALGGSGSPEWDLVRKHRLPEMVADALDRGLPVKELKAAVTGTPFIECKCYERLRDEIGGRHDFPK